MSEFWKGMRSLARPRTGMMLRMQRRNPNVAAIAKGDAEASAILRKVLAGVGTVENVRTDRTRAQELYQTTLSELNRLRGAGYTIGPHSYLRVMSTCAALKKASAVDNLFQQMVDDGVPPGVAHFTQLMQMRVNAAEPAQGVCDAMRKMNEAGVKPNLRAMNVYLLGLVKGGDYAAALGVLDEMEMSGPAPDQVSYNTVLGACGRLEEVSTVLSRMERAGLQGDLRSVNAVLKVLKDAQDLATLETLVEEVARSNVKPDTTTYNILMSAYRALGDLDGIQGVLDRMELGGVEPDGVSYVTLLSALSEHARSRDDPFVEAAERTFELAVSKGMGRSQEIYDRMLTVYATVGDADKAQALHERCKREARGVKLSSAMAEKVLEAKRKQAGGSQARD
eukprot:Hpha_TRINITY_DN17585_c0_g1::TRINITY_DN17585_c0_g1_i1::g.92439::m.92439